jgi:AbrB family looped-hinge helix DNA binding protein
MSTATLTSKGQTTIPKDVREHLGLQPGDRLEFILGEGSVILRPATRRITDLKGFLPKPRRALSLQDMDRALRRRARSE